MRAVNLIPSEQRPGGGGAYGRSGGAAYALLGLAAGLVVMGVMWLMARHDINDGNAQVAQLTAQAQQLQSEAGSLASYNTFVSMASQRVSSVEQLAQDRFDWAHAFHELGRVLPADVAITNASGTVATTSGTGAAPAPSTGGSSSGSTAASSTPAGSVPTLDLSGCSTSQSEVAETLRRLSLMDGVTNVTLHSSATSSNSGGGSAAGSGYCLYAFSVTVTYTPLPAVSAASAAGAAAAPGLVATSSAPAVAGSAGAPGAGASTTAATGGAAHGVTPSTAGTSGSAPAGSSTPPSTGTQPAAGTQPTGGGTSGTQAPTGIR